MSLLSPSPSTTTAADAIRLMVIDTNVILDWLVFEDASARSVGAAIAGGLLQWIATPAMYDEFSSVLMRPTFGRFASKRASIHATVDRYCVMVAEPSVSLAARLPCSDPDDQKFIDLALLHPAHYLLSRDKALLRLARKSSLRGLQVLTPAAWSTSGFDERVIAEDK